MNDDKFIDIIASVALGESVSQLPIYFLIGNGNAFLYLAATIASAIVSGPIIYHTVRKIRKKKQEEDIKRFNCVQLAIKGLHELETEDKLKVNQETVNFYKKITDALQEETLELSTPDVCTLNDLIYLINANYYYEIAENTELERDDVIERIILQAILHLKHTSKTSINSKDIETIINNCFFIKENTKHDIIEEFNSSAVDFNGWVQHGVENRYIGTEKAQEEMKKSGSQIAFDVNHIEHYKMLIEGLTAGESYLREYGNIDNIEWDYELLREVFSIMINKFKPELKRLQFEDGYSEFNIARSYFHNIMCYAVMNQKAVVDYQSMLATFKDWDYLPFKIKFDMATTIIDTLNLEDIKHPYLLATGKKIKPREKTKIYHFQENN